MSKGVHSRSIIHRLLVSMSINNVVVVSAPIQNTTKSGKVKKPNINCDFFEFAGIKKLSNFYVLLLF